MVKKRFTVIFLYIKQFKKKQQKHTFFWSSMLNFLLIRQHWLVYKNVEVWVTHKDEHESAKQVEYSKAYVFLRYRTTLHLEFVILIQLQKKPSLWISRKIEKVESIVFVAWRIVRLKYKPFIFNKCCG